MHFQFMDTLSHSLLTHPERGLWITFFVAFLESLPLLGTIFPGAIFMTVIGMLAGRGLIGFMDMIIISTIGAFVGDILGFWLGRAFHEKLPSWPIFRKRQHWLEKGEQFFQRHGGKGVLIGRFVGPIRSSVPMIAGLLQMGWQRFIPVALVAAIAWSIVYLLPGVLVGAISLQLSTPQVTLFLVTALAVVALLWAIVWLCQRFFSYLSDLGNRFVASLWFFFQRMYGARWVVRVVTNKEDVKDYHQLTRLLIAFVLLLCVVVFTVHVFTNGTLTHLNHPVFFLLQSLHRPWLTKMLFGITMLGDKHAIAIATVIIMCVLAWQKHWRHVKYLAITMLFAFGSVMLFKLAFYEPRPMGLAHPAHSSAFPSGHTTLSSVFYGVLAYWTMQQVREQWRFWVKVAAFLLVGLVGLSRLYLGAHWVLDVMSGWCLGSAILLVSITFFRRKPSHSANTLHHWAWVMLIAVVLSWGSVTWSIGPRLLEGFEPIWSTAVIDKGQWLSRSSSLLPAYRRNRVGHPSEPFNLQWAAPIQCVTSNLVYHDWQLVTHVSTVKSVLTRFTSHKAEDHLFMFKRLFRQRPPIVYMMKRLPDGKSLAVIRLWSSGVSLKNGLPIWVGSVSLRSPKANLFSLHAPEHYGKTAQDMLNPLVYVGYRTYRQQVPMQRMQRFFRKEGWHGGILFLLSPYTSEESCS